MHSYNDSRKAVVTGATGFLGRWVVRTLLKRDIAVTILTRNRKKAEILFPHNANLTIIECDITDYNALLQIPEQAAIFHCAAITGSVQTSKSNYEKINVDATLALLKVSILRHATRFAFVSSVSAVGAMGSCEHPITEETKPNPTTFYGISKLNAEKNLQALAPATLPMTIIRPPLIYGKEQTSFSGAGLLFNLCQKKIIPILGNKDAKLSLIYVENAANGLIDLTYKNQKHEIYNLSDAYSISIKELVGFIQRNTITPPTFISIPYIMLYPFGRIADGLSSIFQIDIRLSSENMKVLACNGSVMSIEKAKNAGYSPSISVENGIQITCDKQFVK